MPSDETLRVCQVCCFSELIQSQQEILQWAFNVLCFARHSAMQERDYRSGDNWPQEIDAYFHVNTSYKDVS